jgi:hypothetical protein
MSNNKNSRLWKEAVQRAREAGVPEQTIENLLSMKRHFGDKKCADMLSTVADSHSYS